MSNGGFFSYKLACDLSDRIAAIASVTGTMNVGQTGTCNPSHPMPVMEIHGTADPTVAYEGNFFFASTPSVVTWWADFNDCDTPASINPIDDTDTGDGCTAEHHAYINGNNGSSVEHYKIIGGQHTWPGSAFGGVGTNQDIDASKEIWKFFSKYDIHGLINTTGVYHQESEASVLVYPNPASDLLTVEWQGDELTYTLISSLGQPLHSGVLSSGNNTVDLSSMQPGMYILMADKQALKIMKTH
jgi:polyhydroxybutyrate depolymerase